MTGHHYGLCMLPVCWSVCWSVDLSVCVSVDVSVCVSVCVSVDPQWNMTCTQVYSTVQGERLTCGKVGKGYRHILVLRGGGNLAGWQQAGGGACC